MTNREKAKEIASLLVDTDQTEAYKHLVALIEQTCNWKDEQFEAKKKRLSDRACKWLSKRLFPYVTYRQDDGTMQIFKADDLVTDFRNYLEKQL